MIDRKNAPAKQQINKLFIYVPALVMWTYLVTTPNAVAQMAADNQSSREKRNPPPEVSLTVTPSTITAGQSATIIYTSTNVRSCVGSNFVVTSAAGRVTVSPPQTTTYVITCTGRDGTAAAAATLNVIPSAPQGRIIPNPIYGVTLDTIGNVSGEITSLQHMPYFPTARVVFDYGVAPSYYLSAIQKLHPYTYLMGQVADSSDMRRYTVSSYKARAQSLISTLGSQIDFWEIGNEVNGRWLGTNTQSKIAAAYDVVTTYQGATALTFFYMGEPNEPGNCIDAPGDDMFTWITNMFNLNAPPAQRSPETEKIRLGLNYVFVSWYPDGCRRENPNWPNVFNKLANIFPNSKIGFGELGTARPQRGSQFEINLINQYYPMAKTTALPASYVGGYFWWYFAEEMVPYTSKLMNVLIEAIKAGPAPAGNGSP